MTKFQTKQHLIVLHGVLQKKVPPSREKIYAPTCAVSLLIIDDDMQEKLCLLQVQNKVRLTEVW